MSEVPSDAEAKALLRRLSQRTRLLALARGRTRPSFPWCVIAVVVVTLALMACPWEISDRTADLLFLVALVFVLAADSTNLNKRLDALAQLLDQEGLLQDELPARADKA